MSRYEEFLAIHDEIAGLETFMEHTRKATDAIPFVGLVIPLVNARIAQRMAAFDEPAPVPVEPVKPKAKRGDVDGSVGAFIKADPNHWIDKGTEFWGAWAAERGFNRKSVLAAVRRHTEKNKT